MIGMSMWMSTLRASEGWTLERENTSVAIVEKSSRKCKKQVDAKAMQSKRIEIE
jgi:hypothetical protein